MANPTQYFGLQSVTPNSSVTNTIRGIIAATDTSVVGPGDAVILSGATGLDSLGNVCPVVTRYVESGGTLLFGVVSSVFNKTNFAQTISTASTLAEVELEAASKNTLFKIRANGSLTTSTCIGQYADIAVTAPSSTLGISQMSLDTSTVSSSAGTLPLEIVGFLNDGVNVSSTANPVVLVRLVQTSL
jgi:hypothetical protein